ncbi:MAG: cytochrome c [Pseudomonadota bacterium]
MDTLLKRMMVVGALAAATVLAGCFSDEAARPAKALEPPRGNAVAGLRLAEAYCSSCHAIGESGASREQMAPPFRTLAERYPIDSLGEAFAEGILTGHPSMPQFEFTPTQIDDLLAYIQHVQTRRGG